MQCCCRCEDFRGAKNQASRHSVDDDHLHLLFSLSSGLLEDRGDFHMPLLKYLSVLAGLAGLVLEAGGVT